MSLSPKRATLLLLVALLFVRVAPVRSAQTEEALSPEFLEYLGTVEASGIKGLENLSMEEIYQVVKKALLGKQKKNEDPAKKESEHGDAPKN